MLALLAQGLVRVIWAVPLSTTEGKLPRLKKFFFLKSTWTMVLTLESTSVERAREKA